MATRQISSYMHNWIEVAPAPLISPQKPSSSTSPKLEPIAEEESDRLGSVHKKAFYLLPVVLSIVSYIWLNRNII
ncbi:hypothetical protein U1Q18_009638, partial [Sarracenia purpurea var. burkii]